MLNSFSIYLRLPLGGSPHRPLAPTTPNHSTPPRLEQPGSRWRYFPPPQGNPARGRWYSKHGDRPGMSHAWVTVTNGPFMETLNEKLAANLLCDITGFQLPFPAIDRYNMESAEVAAAGAEHLQDIDDTIAEFNRQQAAMGASPEQAVEGGRNSSRGRSIRGQLAALQRQRRR